MWGGKDGVIGNNGQHVTFLPKPQQPPFNFLLLRSVTNISNKAKGVPKKKKPPRGGFCYQHSKEWLLAT